MRKIAARLLVLVILVGVVAGGYYLVQQIPQEKEEFPLAPVRRGDLIVKTHLRGRTASGAHTFVDRSKPRIGDADYAIGSLGRPLRDERPDHGV